MHDGREHDAHRGGSEIERSPGVAPVSRRVRTQLDVPTPSLASRAHEQSPLTITTDALDTCTYDFDVSIDGHPCWNHRENAQTRQLEPFPPGQDQISDKSAGTCPPRLVGDEALEEMYSGPSRTEHPK